MSQLDDQQLCGKAWTVLERELGPVDALRFLSVVRRQPRDYRAWREEHLGGLTAADLIAQIQAVQQHES